MGAVGAGEADAGFGEAVHIGGVDVGVACAGHGAGVLLVGDDEEDVGTVWHDKTSLVKYGGVTGRFRILDGRVLGFLCG